MPISLNHQFTAPSITVGQAVENRPQTCVEAFKQGLSRLFRSDQLAVEHQGTGLHIATNVTQAKLDRLQLADAQNVGGHTAENLRRSDRLLAGMGIPVAGLGNEMRIRLARIGVEDPALALSIQQIHAQGVLGANTALNLARAAESHGIALSTAVLGLAPHVAGALNPQILDEIASIATEQPELATKLVARATATANGAPGALTLPQLTWLVHTATTDDVLADLHGPNFANPGALPTAVALGFQPVLHIQLDPVEFANMQAQFGGRPDLQFDGATNTVHSGLSYQRLMEMARPLADAGRNALPPNTPLHLATTWSCMEWAFGNPTAVTARQDNRLDLLAACISNYSNPNYALFDLNVHVPTLTNDLNGQNNAQSLTRLLNPGQHNFPGITISEAHDTTNAKQFLIANMANLQAEGVNTIYIEHIQQEYQGLLNQYLGAPPLTPMPPDLEAFLRGSDISQNINGAYPNNLRGLVEAAKASGMRVVGLDDNNLSRRVNMASLEIRDVTVNRLGEQVINGDAVGRGAGKYVILAGRAHNHSHRGLLNGIPGFAQLLDIPAVQIDGVGNLGLDPDNQANRIP